jgi:hypothetical protein
MQKVIVLTLKKHRDGVWITRLVQCLERILILSAEDAGQNTLIEVQSLETWMGGGWLVSSPCFDNISAIINRVSDAASPSHFKATLAILEVAQSRGIPIINGPRAYALCGNKWCHHVLFSQAGLSSPPTLAFWNDSANNDMVECLNEQLSCMKLLERGSTLLSKPNAGGFGAGIAKLTPPLKSHDIPVYEDSITLIQKYEQPIDNKFYRVWFLRGEVQCAIEREVTKDKGASEFTNACSGSCSMQQPPKAWSVPPEVKDELEEKLLPLLLDAHCGSVEFLYCKDDARLYFDLNLLSTLPINVLNADGVWDINYDPWMQLSQAVWDMVKK